MNAVFGRFVVLALVAAVAVRAMTLPSAGLLEVEGEQVQAQAQAQSAAQETAQKAEQKQLEQSMSTDAAERLHSGVAEASVSFAHDSSSSDMKVVTIPLARATVANHQQVLLELQARQIHDEPSLLEMSAADVPLTQEVLREKHLATYYGIVSIGDTKFRILFDTGSCEFWVPSTDCEMERCKRHRRYPIDEHSSSRFMARNRLNIQYLSGRVSGKMVYEAVHTGDVTVNRQIVGVADHVDIVLLDDVIWDGILGLAYPNKALNAKGVVPFFDNVIRSGALHKRGLSNQFGYYIDDARGSVTFGGVDCGLLGAPNCIKHFGFVPVSEKAYWSIRLNDVRVQYGDDKPLSGFCPRSGCKAIVDTGTYLLYGPGPAVRKMLRPAKFAGCSTLDRLPTFTFDFKVGDDAPPVELQLRPIDYVLKFEADGKAECVTGISPDRDVIWTLGQVFLRSFYTVFDRDQNRIGFARLPRTEFTAINAHADRQAQSMLETQSAQTALDFAELLKAGATTEDQVIWADQNAADEEDTDAEAQADAEEAEAEAEEEEADEAEDAAEDAAGAEAEAEEGDSVEIESEGAVDEEADQ